MEPVTLRTERLVLRPLVREDAEAVTRACQDPEIPRWTTVPSPYALEDAIAFIQQTAQWWADGAETVWGVFADDRLAGCIGLHAISAHKAGGDAEIGFWMVEEARGRGYLLEAGRAVIDWAFAELGLVRIEWRAVVGNIPSARSARALGFRFEGTHRQVLASPRGRDDGWLAGLLHTDDRAPVAWPIPLDG